jgi:hypothetical protein
MRTRGQNIHAIEAPTWTPEEFILRGSYCPRPAILDSVERARRDVGAEAALIVAADEGALLRSLCFQAPKQMETPYDLVGLLRSVEQLNRRISSGELVLTRPSVPGDEAPFPRSAPHLMAGLATLAREEGRNELATWLSPQEDWIPARIPTAATARISVAVLFLEPDSEYVVDQDEMRLVEAGAQIVEITERVNATVQADVRRDAAIMARLDDQLDPADFAEGTVDLKQAANSLVQLAVEVSRSDVGACYVFDHGRGAMTQTGFAVPDPLREAGWVYPDELDENSHALAFSSLSNRRPIQLPPGFPTEDGVVATCMCASDIHSESVELATPIVGPLASPKAPAVGVLTVARIGTEDAKYGAYDLAVLRNISLRLALINATANTEAAARVFARLSTRATDRIRSQTAVSGPLRGLRLTEDGLGSFLRAPLPDDLYMTLPAIQEGLETLGRITGSYSATFRAALPSPDTTGPHGLTLRRVAAYPKRWLEAEGALQREEQGGLNWKVALTGTPQYAPVVEEEDAYLESRKETLSELCVPVLVEGRVIGVVNLESADRNAYDALVTTAQAFAAHVGLAIADARIAISSVLHDYAIEIVRRGHELGGQECRDLRALAAKAPARNWQELLEKSADEIERKAKGLRAFASADDDPVGPLSFPELVLERKAALELDFAELLIDPTAEWQHYPPGVAQIVSLALKDVLGNLKRHSATSAAKATMLLYQGPWGGELHDILRIVNRPSAPLDPVDAINAYRALLGYETPDPSADGSDATLRVPQIGAYLAGTMARRVGGDVHLCQRVDGLTQVTLSIPSNPQQHDWSG